VYSLSSWVEVSVVRHWQEWGLCHRRSSWKGVFPSWKTEFLDCCITTVRACCKKDGHHRKWACRLYVDRVVLLWRCIFQMGEFGIWHISRELHSVLLEPFWRLWTLWSYVDFASYSNSDSVKYCMALSNLAHLSSI